MEEEDPLTISITSWSITDVQKGHRWALMGISLQQKIQSFVVKGLTFLRLEADEYTNEYQKHVRNLLESGYGKSKGLTLHKREQDESDNEQIDNLLDEVAIVPCDNAGLIGLGDGGISSHDSINISTAYRHIGPTLDGQVSLAQILLDKQSNDRGNQVFDKRVHNSSKCSAKNDGNGQIDNVPFGKKGLKVME